MMMPIRRQAALLRCVYALSLACMATAAAAAAPLLTLTLGQQSADSVAADIGEQVVTEACRRAEFAVAFKRLPLARSIESASDGGIDAALREMKREGLIERIYDDNPRKLKIRRLVADDRPGAASARMR